MTARTCCVAATLPTSRSSPGRTRPAAAWRWPTSSTTNVGEAAGPGVTGPRAPRRVVACAAAPWTTRLRVAASPPPEPASIYPTGWHETIGSSGAGKAMYLARLGVDVTLPCLLGEAEAGAPR